MPLIRNTYGKGGVRVMRVHREGGYNEVRELTLQTMLDGEGMETAYTAGDNRSVVATDTIRNITYIVARENLAAGTEAFVRALARCFLERYAHVGVATVTARETGWTRLDIDGTPHPHAFTLDGNGRRTVRLRLTRSGEELRSGIEDFTFMKSTGAGWVGYWMDECTTLPETTDRIVATAMTSSWLWASDPLDFAAANAKVLSTMMGEFATTYSMGVQDSLYRMGEAAIAAVPEVSEIAMTCPNKHYLVFDLSRFGLDAGNSVFVPTDEPHGQIECTIGRQLPR